VEDRSLTELIRIYFKAYETKDRSALESTLSNDFAFTSQDDNHIDRATYLRRCWPNSKHTRAIHIRKLFDRGNEAFVLYDLEPDNHFATQNSSLEAAARSKRSKCILVRKSGESRTSSNSVFSSPGKSSESEGLLNGSLCIFVDRVPMSHHQSFEI
jgi:ketosteroid isomerase-like protein